MTDAHRDTPLRWGGSRELTPFELGFAEVMRDGVRSAPSVRV
ncbi:hypothetical protein [Mycobacterium sp. AT1]|nr:hypothetical protein [Mycobacterium sp. AT1]